MATFRGTSGADAFRAPTTEVNFLHGEAGADRLWGGYLPDQIYGGSENDFLYGGAGEDLLDGGAGNDLLDAGTGDDIIYDKSGTNVIKAGTGDDTVHLRWEGEGAGTVNSVYLGSGDDWVYACGQIEKVDGEAGEDTVSYAYSPSSVSVSLQKGTGSGGWAAGDRYWSIEDVTGSKFNDTLIGNAVSNTIKGGNGDDKISGGAGPDLLDGGTGIDTLSYAGAVFRGSSIYPIGVSVNLQNGAAIGSDAEGDVIRNFENVTGTTESDEIWGNSKANVLRGGGGNDRLHGGDGNDTLYGAGADRSYGNGAVFDGGAGNDSLIGGNEMGNFDGGTGNDWIFGGAQADNMFGGAGKDKFVYRSISDSAGYPQDTIFDFEEGDIIDLRRCDANSGVAGNQAFEFIGTAEFTGAGQIRYVQSILGETQIISNEQTEDGYYFGVNITGLIDFEAGDFLL